MTPCANLVLTSEVTDRVANTATVPQGMNKVFTHKAETEALCSASTFATRLRTKHHSVLRSQNLPALSPLFGAELRDHPWALIAVFMQLQRLRVLPEF